MSQLNSNKVLSWIVIIIGSLMVLSSIGFIINRPILTTIFEYSLLLFLVIGFLHMLVNGTIIKKNKFLISIFALGLLPALTVIFEFSIYFTPLLLIGLNVGSQLITILIYFLHYRQKQSKSRLDHLKLIWLTSTQTLNIIGYQIKIMHWPGDDLVYRITMTLSVLLVLYYYWDGVVNQSWITKDKNGAQHEDKTNAE